MDKGETVTRQVGGEVPPVMEFDGIGGGFAFPQDAGALVVVVHTDAVQAHQPPERFVVEVLQAQGHGSLVVTLKPGPAEAQARGSALLIDPVQRVERALDWASRHARASSARVALLAIGAVAGGICVDVLGRRPHGVDAMVMRGAPPDLAQRLVDVRLPTLVIVGMPEGALVASEVGRMRRRLDHARVHVLIDVGSAFEQPGAHEAVARLAARWFGQSLHARSRAPRVPVQAWQPAGAR